MKTYVSSFFGVFFFPSLNGISIVVDLKTSFFCKVWIKDVSHVSFLKRYWTVLLMCKSWILWWCYVCYIVFILSLYIFLHILSHQVEIMMRCRLDGSSRGVECFLCSLVKWRTEGEKQVPAAMLSVETLSTGICNFILFFFVFSFILDVAWH